jgi:Caspase domain
MKLFALLVGINRYKAIRGLNACETDVNSVKTYLTESHGSDANIKTLIDQEATRDGIVSHFRTHLKQAKQGDVAFFYFSGHGVRQKANDVFKSSSLNDNIECITCHDTSLDGRNLLSDKEIRWLIHELYTATKCHIVMVFDSCHSGDATRGLGDVNPPEGTEPMKRTAVALASNPTEQSRMPELILPVRQWSDFIFANKLKEDFIKKTVSKGDSLDEIFPQGNHIHLAAASSNEPAWEAGGTGLFTKSLLEVLRATNEKITYYDFRSLAYQRLNRYYGGSKKNIRQSPQIYSFEESLFQPFFGGIVQQKGIETNLYYNEPKKQWEIDMGAIYGIPEPTDKQPIQLLAKIDATQTASVYVKKVFSDYCVIGFDEAEEARQMKAGTDGVAPPIFDKNKQEGYKCLIKKLLQKPLKVAYIGTHYAAEWANFSTKNTALLDLSGVISIKSPSEADYVLNTEGGGIFMAKPAATDKPLAEQVFEKDSDKAFSEILTQFATVSRWEFVKQHENKTGGKDLLGKIKIDIADSKGSVYTPQNGKIDIKFNFSKIQGAFYSKEEIEIKITNTSAETLYVVSAWLGERFGIDCTYINQNSIASPLEAGKSVALWGSTMPLRFLPYIKSFGWSKLINLLKIYVSDAPFNITLLQQLDLDPPLETRSGIKAVGRPEPVQEEAAAEKTAQWAVQTVEMVINC